MRAVVVQRHADGVCTAQTDNDLALTFGVRGGLVLAIGTECDVDLLQVLATQTITRVADGAPIAISIGAQDIHDLRARPTGHDEPRTFVSRDRLARP